MKWLHLPLFCLTLLLSVLEGCALVGEDYVSIPTIHDSQSWKIEKRCGYEGCTPMVDYLTRNDMSIRIEAYNHEGIFLIQVVFLSDDTRQLRFNPSSATVEIADHRIINAKGFQCAYTITEEDNLRSAPPLVGPVRIADNACFFLFFDAPPPSVEEQFIFRLEGITRSERPVHLPEMVFRKGVRGHYLRLPWSGG
jgi:hypothetical protein